MTDRHIAYVVTLEDPARSDDSQHLLDLIRRLRGVVSVVPVTQNAVTVAAYERALHNLRSDLAMVFPEGVRDIAFTRPLDHGTTALWPPTP